MQAEIDLLKTRLDELRAEHRHLDRAIAELRDRPGGDQLQLQRLKKNKLLLKDRIAMLERQLTPDVRA